MAYLSKLTPGGAAALAAATAGSPVELATMAVGDADGVAYEPTGAEGDLVNQTAEVDLLSVEVDPTNDQQLLITAIIPVGVGGFTVREAAVKLEDGSLFAIANIPATDKPDGDDNAAVEMVIVLTVGFSGDANVHLSIDASAAFATQGFVYAARHFFAVKSATETSPPGGAVAGDHFLVPPAAEDEWDGQDDKIAIYLGAVDGWLFVSPPQGATARAADDLMERRRTPTGWVEVIDGMAPKTTLTGAEEMGSYDPDVDANRKITSAAVAALAAALLDEDIVFWGLMA